jgi:hypothetical protein
MVSKGLRVRVMVIEAKRLGNRGFGKTSKWVISK